jgi:hypothetical protein
MLEVMSGDNFVGWHNVIKGKILLKNFLNQGKIFLERKETFTNRMFKVRIA